MTFMMFLAMTSSMSAQYCVPEGTNATRYINNFSTTGGSDNISNLASGFSPAGYGDFTATHTVSQYTGADVNFSADVLGGTAGFRIWVDWNQDGEFGTDEVAYISSSYKANHVGVINVPAGALEGTTRMRIVSHFLSNSANVSPCAIGFGNGEFEDYNFEVVYPSECTGTPDAGMAVVNPSSGNPGDSYTVSAQGYTSATELSFVWQSNTDSAGWVDQGTASGSYSPYTATAPAALGSVVEWRMALTCTPSSEVAYSDIATFTTAITYCSATAGSVEPITRIIFGGVDNASSPLTSSPSYEDFTAITAEVEAGGNYSITAEGNTAGNYKGVFTVWIDWDQNGIFDADEMYNIGFVENSTGADGKQAISDIEVPTDALLGNTRMRIRKNFNTPSTNPCGSSSYGQIEDYTVNVSVSTGGGTFPAPYCDIADAVDVIVEEITKVDFAGTSIANTDTTSVLVNKTDTIVNVTAGQTYTILVEGNTNGDFETNIVAFVDWDQNDTLNDAGEIYELGTLENSTGADGKSVTMEIIIPTDAVLGETRIRITKTYFDDLSDAIINPCGIEFDPFGMGVYPGYGQALDFTLNILEDTGNAVACSQNHPTGTAVGGIGSSVDSDYKVASDIMVAVGEDFTLRTIEASFMTFAPEDAPVTANVVYYTDNGGLPGTVIGSETVVPTIVNSQPWGNPVAFQFNTSLAITPFTFEGNATSETKYWIEISMGTATNQQTVFWEHTIGTPMDGLPLAQFDGTDWTFPNATHEVIYNYIGLCAPMEVVGVTCSQEHLTATETGGVGSSVDSDYKSASDIMVAIGEDFTLETIEVPFLTFAPLDAPTTANVVYYSDNGGLPGTVIGSETVVPTILSSQPWINPIAFQFETSLTVTPFTFEGNATTETKYWIEISMGTATSQQTVFWEHTIGSPMDGLPLAQFDGTEWTFPDTDNEVIYNYMGVCSPMEPALDCTGTPDAGIASVNPAQGNINSTYTVSATGIESSNGLTFQWQSNTDSAGWIDEGGLETTYSTYAATAPSVGGIEVDWRLAVTCTFSLETAYSDVATFTTISGLTYCIPELDCSDNDMITNVTFQEIDNTTVCSPNGYGDYTALAAVVQSGGAYPISVSVGDGWSNESVSVWIDFNENGTFDQDEFFYIGTGSDEALTGTISIPAALADGNYRMRVRVAAVGPATATWDMACDDEQGYGETEDYTVTVDGVMGVNDNASSTFTYYPNPMNEVLNITSKMDVESISVYNVLGQEVLGNKHFADGKVDVSTLPAGTFVVRLTFESGQVENFKVVKN